MKHIIIISFAVLVVSCNKHEIREVKNALTGQTSEKFQVIENKEGSFLKDGYYKTWYEDLQIECDGNYSMNKKDGHWGYWYSNGQLAADVNFKEDSLDGLYKEWHNNAQLSIEGEFDFGKKIGEWTLYHDNGQQKAKELYNTDGMKEGNYISWYSDGGKEEEGAYKNDKKEGIWSYWEEDSSLTRQELFKEGKNIILVGDVWVDRNKDNWQFFEDGTYSKTSSKSKSAKKGKWEINSRNIKLDGYNLKINFISLDSVYATRWVDDWWYGSYEAQRFQVARQRAESDTIQ